MKKFLLLIICSAFSVITNAQTFYVANSTDVALDVTGIGKFFTTCNTAYDCAMSDITNIVTPGNPNASQAFPASCATNNNIMMFVKLQGTTFTASISYCGTTLTDVPTGIYYL